MIEKFQRYAELVAETKLMEEEMKALKDTFKAVLEEKGVEVIESDYGTVSLCKRRSYQYSEDIVLKTNELKEMKTEAEARGDATFTESQYLRFDSIKKA